MWRNIFRRKKSSEKEIVTVSYSKNHSNFDNCFSFYVHKYGENCFFDAICKSGYIAFENILISKTDVQLLCSQINEALEVLEKYRPPNKRLVIDDVTTVSIKIIFADQNSIMVNMIEQNISPLETMFFELAEKYYRDI